MDDLLNIATKTMEHFDPATDKVDDFEEIADGEYTCLLEKVTNKKSEKGTAWISLDFSMLDNEDNRHIFVSYFFTEKTIERSIKAINKLAYDFGYQLPVESFTDLETLADTLNGMAGNQAIVSKKTSGSGFVNYKVTPLS
ncbi:MAG: hypothetical protein IJL74_00635 [Bacilli bacterium]|nr:hypothetical protein [Bacilli bacterium]